MARSHESDAPPQNTNHKATPSESRQYGRKENHEGDWVRTSANRDAAAAGTMVSTKRMCCRSKVVELNGPRVIAAS